MKKYDFFLFDADNTLYDFDHAEDVSLSVVFNGFGISYNDGLKTRYREINLQEWENFEKGLTTKEILLVRRFERLFEEKQLKINASYFNEHYIRELAKGTFLIEGAEEICKTLTVADKKIYIVTNGDKFIQESRIGFSDIYKFIINTFISEHVGFNKPQIEYFNYVFASIPDFIKEKSLIIGDSLSADIKGGINAGIDTCWFNRYGQKNPTDLKPTYEIRNLREINKFI